MRITALTFALGVLLTCASSNALVTDVPTVLITGASRGIGLEFARQYAERGWNVIATARTPADDKLLQDLISEHDNVTVEELDVTNHAEIDTLAKKLQDQPIDILISNAGISGGYENQIFGKLNYKSFDDVFAVNVKGPLKIAEAFINHVAASEQKKLVNISSTEGRFSQLRGGGGYFYRGSKSALNMAMRNVALAVKSKGVIVGILTPGFVDTDFTARFDSQLKITVEESVSKQIAVIDTMTPDMSGVYVSHEGIRMSW